MPAASLRSKWFRNPYPLIDKCLFGSRWQKKLELTDPELKIHRWRAVGGIRKTIDVDSVC